MVESESANQPTRSEKALLVATCAAGIMASHESWRAFGEERIENQTFEDWSIDRGLIMARGIYERLT